MTDLARFILYPLGALFIVSFFVNAIALDWGDTVFALGMVLVISAVLSLIEYRTRLRQRKWLTRCAELNGLERCPISHKDLRELFEYLNRPNPPRCSLRLRETYEFLDRRSLPIETMLEWLHANGAKCDCEVIMNTSCRFGDEVGFTPVDGAPTEG